VAEGASVYVEGLAGSHAVISDEAMMADMVGEDLDAMRIHAAASYSYQLLSNSARILRILSNNKSAS